MKQLPGIREHSYVNDMLPELIWLGLINDHKGYRFGARVLEAVVQVTKNTPSLETPLNLALQSAYASFPEKEKEAVRSLWREWGLLDDIRYALAPLVLLYDGFALAFVGPPQTVISQDTLIARIKASVGNHLDKYETPGIALHGAMMLTRMMAGTIHFAAHINIPDFNSIFEIPGSDEAKRAAAFMRANATAEWGMLEIGNEWAKYFWNRGAQLTPCERSEYGVHDD